jgi:hypothetical protein
VSPALLVTEINKQTPNPRSASQDRENAIRRRLGIPDDARKVIVFAESSHWDPSWIRTSEEYFQKYVRQNLDDAVSELLREPRRIYSAECVFFLRMYWDARPEQRENVRRLVNEGRLRLTNSGVTAADTIVPDTEALLRDFLIGQEWLRANGMTQEPLLAFFPDSFGHSPALPSLLKAAGFSMTTITRIDGMLSPSSYHEMLRRFPRPGSTAALLKREKRTLDFIWRGPDGAEVLCHWNAFTYGQGDLIAHRGITRVYVFPAAFGDRSDWNVRHKIEHFAGQLAPYSLTPYLYCPMGGDFVGPLPDLLTLLDRYNRLHYHKSGLWAVNAGLDDYLALVDCHRDVLPVLEIDPNPYWTGFYTSRPTLKKKGHDLVERLLLAERLAMLPENEGDGQAVAKSLEDAWWYAAVSNHHDFITGTSPDRVVEGEQEPWLDKAAAEASAAIARFSESPSVAKLRRAKARPAAVPEWRGQGRTLEIRTPYYVVELDENVGGAISRAWNPATQKPLFKGVSNDLISYYDMGGLWRMGHEFWGGRFKELRCASERPAQLNVRELEGGLEVACVTELDEQTIKRLLWFRSDSPVIRCRVEGMAAERRTVTVRFATDVSASRLVMDAVGGIVVRPPQRIYNPTFWAIQHFLHFQDDASGRGLALCLGMPGAASYHRDGRLEAIALRNATCERAFGLFPLLGLPAQGHEHASHAFDYAILFTPAGDWHENGILQVALSVQDSPWDTTGYAHLRGLAASAVTTDRAEVIVTAVKPASRGEGLIVRLSALTGFGSPVEVTLRDRQLKAAFLCDARERDLQPLEIRGQTVRLRMPGTIATVRLVI